VAKIVLAVFFAAYLVEHRELLADRVRFGPLRLPRPRLRVLVPLLAAWGASILVMVAEKDLGSSLLFFGLFVGVLWVATGQPGYLVAGLGLFAVSSTAAFLAFGHVQTRVHIWLDPWKTASGSGYQIVQSLFAFGSGGLVGSGLALGSPQRIPAAPTDFIFAAIGEELGLVGTTAVLVAFLLIVGSGLRIAIRAKRPFEQLLATGLSLILGLQTFIIVGGVTRLVPLTGITLPFVSYGGSSLLANYVLIALLLRASDEQARA
jgi:peptidoglycan glycosyltransferase